MQKFSEWREDLPLSSSPFKFIAFSMRPHRRLLTISLICVTIAATLQSLIPFIMRQIVNGATQVASGGSTSGLLWGALAYLVVALVAELVWRASGFAGHRLGNRARSTARFALSSYVTLHSRSYFADRFSGSVSNKISHASNGTREIINQILWELMPFVIAVISGFIIVAIVSKTIALIFLGWIAVTAPLNIFFARKRIALSVLSQRIESALNGATVDLLSNVGAMQEYVRRPFELTRLQDLIVRRRDTGIRNVDYGEWILVSNSILQACFVAIMLLYAISLAKSHALSAGDIVLFVTMIFTVEGRMLFLGQHIETFGERLGEIQESLQEIIEPHEITDAEAAKPLEMKECALIFDNLSFAYGGNNSGVLHGFSLFVPGKQKIGLVGKSGAGKSTLIKLMLRHYEVSSGSIQIDGQNIVNVTKDSLRSAISVVPQEPLLFHRSVRENIAYGRPDATDAEIEQAAKMAFAHEFILRLSDGYETMVGERGVKLSGGERQRVAIARAILKNAPILLLDEATSALDSESELAIQQALHSLMQGKTVIAIAHRLSTLREMDRIIVLDKGVINEEGTHEGLMHGTGIYSELWKHQAGGFIQDNVVHNQLAAVR